MRQRTSRAAQPSDRALMKAHLAGLGEAEIAREYGIGRSTVSKRLKRIREALRAEAETPQTITVYPTE